MSIDGAFRHMDSSQVWHLLEEGCSAEEIAAFAGVSVAVGRGMCGRAIAEKSAYPQPIPPLAGDAVRMTQQHEGRAIA